jgi:putative MATE family efflux protein
MAMQMADMIMVGSLGAVSLAAVGLGNQVFFFSIAVVQAFSIGTTALVAQCIGKGDLYSAKKFAGQSLTAVLLTTFLLSFVTVIFSRQIISGIVFFMPEKDLELINVSSEYLRIIGYSISLRFTLLIVNGIFQGAGNTRTPLYLMISSNVLNVAGNYALIFGLGPFPALGVKGAALATSGSGLLTGLVGIGLLFSRFSPIPLHFNLQEFFFIKKEIISRVLSVGIPSAIEQMGIHFSQLIYSMTVASLGSMAIAAHQILHNAYTMTYMPGIGFSLAATIMVGQSLGAAKNERALASGLETARLALIIMSVIGLFFFFSPHTVIGLFTHDAQVQELARYPLVLLALAQPALAYIVSLTGGLRGAGDTRWAMYLTLFSLFIVRLTLTILLVWAGFGLVGVWVAMLAESNLRAIFLYRRFRKKIPHIKPLVTTQQA